MSIKDSYSKNLVVADSSPLIGLGSINQLDILCQLFKKIFIPKAVELECTYDLKKPGALHIQKAIKKGSITVCPSNFHNIQKDNLTFPTFLGEGEIAAIEMAYSLKYMLLIDDLWGRKIASNYQIPILGTAGLLILAKENNIIPAVAPLLDALSNSGYHFSKELIEKILSICKEDI